MDIVAGQVEGIHPFESTAMTLSTTNKDGKPSSRVVLLKGYDEDGPKPSKVYKADIAYIAQKAREEAGLDGLFEGPLGIEILAYFPCPKSKWRVKNPRPEEHHSKRPDADNIAKSIKDGLSGVLYHDDGQISELIVRKRIAAQGDGPRIEVELYKMEVLE